MQQGVVNVEEIEKQKLESRKRLVTDTVKRLPRDFTLYGQAADYLRYTGIKPVARVEYTDAIGERGDYLVGKVVMSSDSMVEFAERKGFAPSWQ